LWIPYPAANPLAGNSNLGDDQYEILTELHLYQNILRSIGHIRFRGFLFMHNAA
jgi:hypothetical protein